MADDLVTEILVQIRDEIRATRTELSARIDATNERLIRLEARQTESDVRISTELVAVAGAIHEVRDLLKIERRTRAKVSQHEERIEALEKRVDKVERKVG